MGYSYEINYRTGRRLLCCDSCGAADGTVERKRCPHGYCPPITMCKGCRTDPVKRAELKAYHVTAGCKELAAAFDASEAAKKAALDSGEFVLCSAINSGDGVKATFRDKVGKTVDLMMSKAAYDARPLDVPFCASSC